MAVTTERLAQLFKFWRGEEENRETSLLLNLLIESLAPWHERVYRHVATQYIHDLRGPLTARDVATDLDMAINHASTVLKQLADYGLLLRTAKMTVSGKEHYYRPWTEKEKGNVQA